LPTTNFTASVLRTAYGVTQLPTTNQGQGVTVAIVDAGVEPSIVADLATYSTAMGLPQLDGQSGDGTFTVSYPQGFAAANAGQGSAGNANDGVETALDVEMVHAMAPKANILLLETGVDSNGNLNGDNLFGFPGNGNQSGEAAALSTPGVVAVSNSYGGGEFSGESYYDPNFVAPNGHAPVAVMFSTGDSGAPAEYPAYSPNVLAIGGTSLKIHSSSGRPIESAWSGGGGGVSTQETGVPSFQSSNGVSYANRSAPDVSLVADTNTSVLVYDSAAGGYLSVGGTSVACPLFAGIVALAQQDRINASKTPLSSQGVDQVLYQTYKSSSYTTDFRDVLTGSNGFSAGTGYDLATGIGSPVGNSIVSLLASA
jgi:subtilase family serine protease